jgi:hypothetical protein
MFRRFAWSSGTLLGVLFAVFALALGGGLWARGIANAQQAGQACFLAAECVGADQVIDACTSKGCCSDDRCFEVDPVCDAAGVTKGAGHCYAKSKPVSLIVPIGGKQVVLDLGDYLASIYTYALSVAGILATVLMMVGGFQYLVGSREPGKKLILQSVGGLLVTFFAYLILQTVNPDLVLLKLPKIQVVKRKDFILCEYAQKLVACGQRFGIKQDNGVAPTPDQLKALSIDDIAQGPGLPPSELARFIETDPTKLNTALIIATCTGQGCAVIGNGCTNDTQFKCGIPDANATTTPPPPACSVTNSFNAVCNVCKGVGESCKTSSDCCGTCMQQADGTKKCQTGAPGERCSTITGGCSQGSKCVAVRGWMLTAFEATTETGGLTNGMCFVGGVGSPCNDGNDCVDENTWCQHVYRIGSDGKQSQVFKANFCVPKSSGVPVPMGSVGGYCGTSTSAFSTDTPCAAGSQCVWLKKTTIASTSTHHGVCSDGSLGSVCGVNIFDRFSGVKTSCKPGLVCVSRITPAKTWTNWWGGVGAFLSGETLPGEGELGTCLQGKSGSPCTSTSDCTTGFTCNASAHVCEET